MGSVHAPSGQGADRRGRVAAGSDAAEVLRLTGLGKDFGDVVALTDVDLVLRRGEVLGYVGPNGTGKTTTFRLLMGAARPTRGSATVFGLDCWRQAPAVHRRVGHVAGDAGLRPRLDGHQHVDRVCRLRGRDDRARAAVLADRLGLDLRRRVGTASRGNRQKLAVVLGLMGAPDLLLLDEPSTGLDPLVQRELHGLLREHTAAGGSVLLSSHVLPEIEQAADRVAVLRAGHLVAVGTTEELRARSLFRVHARLQVPLGGPWLTGLSGVSDVDVDGLELRCRATGAGLPALCAELAQHRVADLDCGRADLEESVLAWYREDR